jgi:hypothetical protein
VQKIKRELYKRPLAGDIKGMLLIRGARIPILKLTLRSGLQVRGSPAGAAGELPPCSRPVMCRAAGSLPHVTCHQPTHLLPPSTQVDLSICNDSGPRAAYYLRQWSDRLPALRPLVLAVKLLLREHHLNDVATGGLGSWALANMVMAHLRVRRLPPLQCLARGARLPAAAAPACLSAGCCSLRKLRPAAPTPAAAA